VSILNSDQITSGRVSLISRGEASTLKFRGISFPNSAFTEVISSLVVEGKGALDFGSEDSDYGHGPRFLLLGDLVIGNNSTLQISDWQDGRDHLLVWKYSQHLEDALKKIEFLGYDRSSVHIKAPHTGDYHKDKDYWEISATYVPEPATYGGFLVASTVSLSLLRRRLKACRGRTPA